ncbi:MAG TPA: hypothetical protein ENK88_09415 [Campylobacterales bacterium]|nr:hypothetical protein [Campylobacterales bacterium]
MLKLITQKAILQKLTTIYNRAEHIKAYLTNKPFGVTIKFKRLSQKDIEQNFLEVRKWIEELNQSSFDIEFVDINYTSIGKQSMPKVLEINQERFLKQLSKTKIFQQHKNLIEQTIIQFPKLRELLISKPNLIILYDTIWIEILKVCE